MVDQGSLAPRDVVIAAAVRTPMGAFQGSLSSFSATELGSIAIKGALERAGISPGLVQEVFMGNVCSANLGQAPASQAAFGAGVPSSVPCTLVNKVCASGMKAVVLGAQTILAGDNDVVVAGGMESMSNVPHYLTHSRTGLRLGHGQMVDGLIRDGLWDPYSDVHMGDCAELCAEHYQISREDMDDHAIEAFERARAAAPYARAEVVPVQLPPSKGEPGGRLLEADESLAKGNAAKLRGLKPFFKQDGGAVTAGNSSPITDGACALVLLSAAKAAELGCPVLAVLRGYGDANQDPEWFTTAPAAVTPKALARAGLSQADIDFWEINQAFSVVDLVNQRLLGLSNSRVNVHGGAVALGHPLGASGAIIITRLLNVLRSQGGRRGLAAICNGGGGASAVVLELVNSPAAQL
ncbi:hypothetical protein OEZ85_008394 [Tetradesmus obliquus]|uniref:acetyl-CoA C-acetyltransferase n=1 Tax=Tetradesmus obliquus TaxID=3088 RepID=A0ABY8TIY1_TETOB|nr:hypothetical protein OEZ85_008394 [Tetradesmus obliquus]